MVLCSAIGQKLWTSRHGEVTIYPVWAGKLDAEKLVLQAQTQVVRDHILEMQHACIYIDSQ